MIVSILNKGHLPLYSGAESIVAVFLQTLLLGLLYSTSLWAQSVDLPHDFLQTNLWPNTRVYVDATHTETFETIRQKDLAGKFTHSHHIPANQGININSYWLSFDIHNPSESVLSWVLHPDNSYLDYLTVYYSRNSQDWSKRSISDHQSFHDRDIPYRMLNMMFSQSPNETIHFYVNLGMLKPDTMNLKLMLSDKKSFDQHINEEQFFLGIYFGVCLTLIIFSALLWYLLRRPVYFSYFLYLISNILFWGFLTGYAFVYLVPNDPVVFNEGFHIVFLLFSVSSIQFSRVFLETRRVTPKLNKVLSALQLFFLFTILLKAFDLYEYVMYVSFFSLLLLILLPVIGVYVYKQGATYAKWYIRAWAIYAIGILISWLSATSKMFDWGMQPLVYTQIASLIESFLLSAALIEKVSKLNNKIDIITKKSQHDELTGLGNRHLLKKDFKNKLLNTQHTKLWMLLIDIDNFKSTNDQYGHLAGDDVLKELANVMRSHSRPEDSVIRYGGEEFILLLNAQTSSAVFNIAQRIRLYFAEHPTAYNNVLIPHTLSLGISEVDLKQSKSLKQAIEQADKALYLVKNNGRNAVAYCLDGTCKVLSPDAVPSPQ